MVFVLTSIRFHAISTFCYFMVLPCYLCYYFAILLSLMLAVSTILLFCLTQMLAISAILLFCLTQMLAISAILLFCYFGFHSDIFSLTQMLAISVFFCCYFLFTQMLTISAIFRSLDVLFGICFTTISAILLLLFLL